MLDIQGLSVSHGHVQAVRQVSLSVDQGEIVALLGANGAGKSSLLSAIAGLVTPSEGKVTLSGRNITGLDADLVAREGLALVPEGRLLMSAMNVRENLLLGGYQHFGSSLLRLLKPLTLLWKDEDVIERLETVFELFPRLRERQTQVAQSLSGGEQQMLAIGRALMASPKLILLDEPSVGLAPELVRSILRMLGQLREMGMAILLVEQDAYGALQVAERGYVMETGRIVAAGSSKELLQTDSLRRAYLGMT